jgi:L-serine dehydratase
MTASAITYMSGGSPKQVESSASLSLQALLGMPCDPISGGKNQPCISRVVTAVTMAIVFSDLALSNKDCVVPFHEVVDVADKMGKMMPTSLKCTSCGGMCETPTANRCKSAFENWHNKQ